jgi:hypothetical protein
MCTIYRTYRHTGKETAKTTSKTDVVRTSFRSKEQQTLGLRTSLQDSSFICSAYGCLVFTGKNWQKQISGFYSHMYTCVC